MYRSQGTSTVLVDEYFRCDGALEGLSAPLSHPNLVMMTGVPISRGVKSTDATGIVASFATSSSMLKGSLQEGSPVESGTRGVALAVENSVPMSERQHVRSDELCGAAHFARSASEWTYRPKCELQ